MKKRTLRQLLLACLCLLTAISLQAETAFSKGKEKGRNYFERRGEVVWEVPTDSKVIAFTFDDGPNNIYTPQILDLLKQHNAKATFFVVGIRVKKHPNLAWRIVQEGHEIANHTYNHPNMRKIGMEKIREEMFKAQDEIFSATGQQTQLFRPPGGYYNEDIVNTVKKAGYLMVMWSWHQDTRDWSNPGVKKIVNQVLSNARNGDIILFHDHGGKRNQTIASLRIILPELKKQGYRFVTVSDLLRVRKKIKVIDQR